MKHLLTITLTVCSFTLATHGQSLNTVQYHLGLEGTYTPGPVVPDCLPNCSGTAYVHGSEANGQVFDPDVTSEIRWDAICEVSGPNQGGANLIIDLRVRRNAVNGPIATEATFSGDTGLDANFSYGVSSQPGWVGRINDPVGGGGANMSFASWGSANPGQLDVLGAGYINWIDPNVVAPGVGRLTLPDGTPGLGHVPIFDGKISIASLPDGGYYLELVQEGHAINVLRGDVDLTQSAGGFARRADITPNTAISFVIQRDDGGGSGGGGIGGGGEPATPPPDSDADTIPDDQDQCPLFDDRIDSDGDGEPDGCDKCPNIADAGDDDEDGDNVGDLCDICPGGNDLRHLDKDGVPDDCDNCPEDNNEDQADADGDGLGDACDETDDGDGTTDGDTDDDGTTDDDSDGTTDGNDDAAPACGSGMAGTGMMAFLTLCIAGMSRRRRF